MPINLKFSQFHRCPLYSSLIPTQPSAPTVLRRGDSVRQKYLGFFSEMVAVSQYLLRIAGVVDLQHRSSLLELPLEPYKRVRSKLSSAPRLFHRGRVVDQVDLR